MQSKGTEIVFSTYSQHKIIDYENNAHMTVNLEESKSSVERAKHPVRGKKKIQE